MSDPAFFDEVRSWRNPATFILWLCATVLATVGAWLLVRAIADNAAAAAARWIIGGLFGAGFCVLFGVISVVLLLRLIRGPRRFRLDSEGFHVGGRSLLWPQVQRVDFRVVRGGAWLAVIPAPPNGRRIWLPGTSLPRETWTRLFSELRGHFDRSELSVEVRVSHHSMY